jgi:ell wall binding domain 2 (CWB2)
VSTVPDERPINADVPAPEPPAAEPEQRAGREKSKPSPTPRRALQRKNHEMAGKRVAAARKPVPAVLKWIAGLVILAVVFIVAAILGGGGSTDNAAPPGAAAPVAEEPTAKEPSEQTASELGYPAFATGNTTRVGGADPTANAAAVALATFPSTTDELRPAAVTLVGEDDWQAAIAASVLMADPIGAPILASSAEGLPEPSADALAALDPQGNEETRGAQAFAIGDVDTGGVEKVTRVKPGDSVATAAAVARLREKLLGGPPEHIVIAPEDPGFAMPAAAWAARSGDPVLFAGRNALPKPTATALKRHPNVPVYVLGPSSSISSDVVRRIAEAGGPVKRVSGEDPVANAIAFARYDDGNFGWNINDPGHGFVVARADSPFDAAAAAPLSASGTWGPLLLTDSADTLPSALRGYLLDVKPGYTTDPTRAFYNHVWVIGDQEAIDVNQQAEIDNLAELAKIGDAP